MTTNEFTTIYTRAEDGLWYFDDPDTDTYEEPLCNGTERAVDAYYTKQTGLKPETGSTILATVTPEEESCEIMMIKTEEAEGGTYYSDDEGRELWFCPFLEKAFGYKPDSLYVSILQTT